MMRVLHISDTHFGTEREPVVHALHALADTLRPDLVVLGGDITQRARRGQFAAARRFIQALQRPVLAVPGNHDIPLFNLAARLFDPYGNYRRALGAVLEPVYEDDRLLAIGVNSTRAARRKNGEVSRAQAQRVAQRLRDARPGQLRVVALHHPVHAMVESDQRNLLIGREFAVPAWVDAGVDLILGGHIHLPYVAPLHGKAGAAGRRAWTVQAGTAVSRRVRGRVPNSVNLIDYAAQADSPACTVQRWDFQADSGAFVLFGQQVLALNRARG
ncbi:calcineurin-like phosphoesterase family protein [Bordetella bronchiseptica MBORD678]|uniref:metallophosphoesterase family protein n=1 Tax=Bordetella bronchiseptica TaxID=518 RepID=UPI0004A0B025|nr:metallophosphoesterase [Bordetella bronchiseptica]KAB1449631.1 metallophosphoesterase [Bordetella bronchiseptica]KAB1575561.1 metallophosphoesterase [Bordetella bronchiseptica]KDD83348.1 calcineurin-like phosphoesterase family protein [Bordetella bronchiseptica MBORD678]